MALGYKPLWLALSFAATMAMPVTAQAEKAPAGIILQSEWSQSRSDIAPDPAAHFGRLPNGMGYIIYKNATPRGTASIHLRIGAGSLMEDEDQRGLAHFLEHMAFNGSKNIPMDQLIPLLQRHGLKFGPDSNAFTTYNKTEYTLSLPTADDETVDTVLMILREMAGNLLLSPDAVERERAVVLGEERLRDSPSVHATKTLYAAEFPDQKIGTRLLPIGLPDVIRSAPPQRIADFYHAFYRPELATLVVVGDIDPDIVEAKIKARFSDWTAIGRAKPVDFGARKPKGVNAETYAEKPLPDQISVTWIKPYEPGPDTRASDVRDIMDGVILGAFNQRLNRLAQEPSSTFIGAQLAHHKLYQSAEIVVLSLLPKPGKDQEAYAQVLSALKQLEQFGLNADEIDTVLSNLGARLQNSVKGERTRNNEAIMNDLITSLDQNEVFTSPDQEQAFFNSIKPQLNVAALGARIKFLISGDGPMLFHQGEDLAGLDRDTLKSGFARAMSQSAIPYEPVATKPWPYTDFGAANAPVSQVDNKTFGFKQYVYANGLKLNVKPTKLKDDQILIQIRFGGGLERFPPDTNAPIGMAELFSRQGGVVNSGLGKLTIEEMKKSLAGKTVGMSYELGEEAAYLAGATNKADFALEMQFLMAFTTDAAWRPDFYARIKALLPAFYASISANPASVAATQMPFITHDQDRRFEFPAFDQANSVPFEAVRDVIAGSVKNTPIEITLVGDVDDGAALAAVNTTFATLPQLPKAPRFAKGGNAVRFPAAAKSVTLSHKGRADQSLSAIVWPVPDYLSDTHVSRGLQLLREILQERMFEQIREKLGQAYDPVATVMQSIEFKGYGQFQAQASVPAGQDEAFEAALYKIVADLRTNPVGADELERARKPVLEHFDNLLKENQHWLHLVAHGIDEPARLAAEETFKAEVAAITPADILSLAQRYLTNDRAVHVKVEPETSIKPK